MPALSYANMPPSYTLYYSSNFAQGLDSCIFQNAAPPAAVAIVDAPGGVPAKVVKVDLPRGRSSAGLDFSQCQTIKDGRDYMITWSTYIPPDFIADRTQPEEIVAIRTANGSPAFGLLINGEHYKVKLGSGKNSKIYDAGPVGGMGKKTGDKGYWMRWSFHYRPDPSGSKSISDLYKNNVLVMTAKGAPNAAADQAYLFMGINKKWGGPPPSEVSKRTIYFGDVAIGGKP